MKPHCEDLVLTPPLFLSHIFKNHDKTLDWIDADNLSKAFLEKYGFAGMKIKD